MLIQTSKSIAVHCDHCSHWKTRHVPSFGCIICSFEIKQGMRDPKKMCMNWFASRLSQREIAQAVAADKKAYERSTRCASCLEIWLSHEGFLCPNGETLFVPLIANI